MTAPAPLAAHDVVVVTARLAAAQSAEAREIHRATCRARRRRLRCSTCDASTRRARDDAERLARIEAATPPRGGADAPTAAVMAEDRGVGVGPSRPRPASSDIATKG